MTESILIPNCACGDRMTITKASDIFVCMNCDGVQAIELENKARKYSPQDKAFMLEMRDREREWYPEQFGRK